MTVMLVLASYFGVLTIAVWLIGVLTGGAGDAQSQQETVVVSARPRGARRNPSRQHGRSQR
jgi:hypothetical protein